jgi:hypothetical protein
MLLRWSARCALATASSDSSPLKIPSRALARLRTHNLEAGGHAALRAKTTLAAVEGLSIVELDLASGSAITGHGGV